MKSKENLSTLKEEAKAANSKLRELTEEKLEQISGGCTVEVGPEGTLVITGLGTYYFKTPRGLKVNPEDSCKHGTCGACPHYQKNGLCLFNLG